MFVTVKKVHTAAVKDSICDLLKVSPLPGFARLKEHPITNLLCSIIMAARSFLTLGLPTTEKFDIARGIDTWQVNGF